MKRGALLEIDGKLHDAKIGTTIYAGGVGLKVVEITADVVRLEFGEPSSRFIELR